MTSKAFLLLGMQGLVRSRYQEDHFSLPEPRCLDEFGMIKIPRLILAPINPHDVLDGFLPTQVRGWLLLRNSRLDPPATCGDTTYNEVSEN